MTTQDRLAKINQVGTAKVLAAQQKANELQQEVDEVKAALRALAPRLNDLMACAKELWRNNIPLGKVTGSNWLEYDVEFMSECIHHRIGFMGAPGPGGDLHREPVGFGIAGGGCCGKSLFIETDGELYSGTKDYYLHDFHDKSELDKGRKFLAGFDDFERRFYEYVDSL